MLLVLVLCLCAMGRTQVIPGKSRTNDGEYNSVNTDGSFDFGFVYFFAYAWNFLFFKY